MCTIIFAHQCHPRYRLVLTSNRDEFYHRPTARAHFWPRAPQILAGQDLQAKGTWLGITATGRLAALTNYRDPADLKPQAPSRGALVPDYLSAHLPPAAYLEKISATAGQYNGFNLLTADLKDMYYYTNVKNTFRAVTPGVHGLSNAFLDTPWTKVEKGKKDLLSILSGSRIDIQDLLDMMTRQEPAPEHELPHTGVGAAMEKTLSPIYVSSPGYGTRSTTAILIEHSGQVSYRERSYAQGQINQYRDVNFNFNIGSAPNLS